MLGTAKVGSFWLGWADASVGTWKLLAKLERRGIDDATVRWTTSWSKGELQQTMLKGKLFDWWLLHWCLPGLVLQPELCNSL